MRNFDFLSYKRNVTSQSGEDGIIEEIIKRFKFEFHLVPLPCHSISKVDSTSFFVIPHPAPLDSII